MNRLSLALAAIAAAACANAAETNLSDAADLKPLVMRVHGVRSATSLDDTTVRVVLGAASTPARGSAGAWRIVSEEDPDHAGSDPNYAYEKFVKPTAAKAGQEKRELEYPGGKGLSKPADVALTRCEVTLTVPFPLKKGVRYSVIGQGEGDAMVTAGTCAASFVHGEGPADDFDPLAARVAGLRRVSSVGDGKIVCEFGHGYLPQAGLRLGDWKVTVNGKPRAVKALGRRTKAECYKPIGWPFRVLLVNDVFLDIGEELRSGDKVVVEAGAAMCAGARTAEMTFDPAKSLSRSLKANQVGYLPDDVKFAYLGCWMGSMPDANAVAASASAASAAAGSAMVENYYSTETSAKPDDAGYGNLPPSALRFRKAPGFRILSWPDGKSVFTGTAKLVHKAGDADGRCDHSAENVYELDFSRFKPSGHGRYVISVGGVGRSIPFEISPGVYQRAFRKQAQGVYSQRCGTALDPGLNGGWKRISCHDRGIAVTSEKRYLCGEWGKFTENCTMVDNPEYEKNSAARAKTLAGAAWRNEAEYTVGSAVKPLERKFRIDPKTGATVIFEIRRDDSIAGGRWGGPVVRFGDDRNGIAVGCNWGVMNFGGHGLKRINDGKWHRAALRILPADAKGVAAAEFVFDGKKIVPERGVARNVLKIPDTVGLGYLNGEGAEGTFFRNVALFGRALGEKEMDALASDVPARIPFRIDAKGGHHDAGDYNPRSHIDVAQTLLEAYELRPGNFADSQLNVPERGNGIPDIVDEAMWAVRLWEGLQDKDGGVYNGTESQGDPHFFQTVELDDKGDYAWAKDPKGSFTAAGVFAQASRILGGLGKKDDAARLLDRARRAYRWGVENPAKDTKGTAQYGEYNIAPRAYAAAQLYHTTGEEAYHKDFKEFSPWTKNPKSELSVWGKYDATRAAYAYALTPADKCDPALRKAVTGAIRAEADMIISGSSKMAYKFLRNPYSPITWGTGAYENYAISTAYVWTLTGERKYRDWLVRTCDNTLGANPLGLSWITGLGPRAIRCPLHNSRYRPEGLPADGLQAQGPNKNGAGYNYNDSVYPRHNDAFAPMQEFADVHFAIAMDEPTVNNMANTMLVFGLLAE